MKYEELMKAARVRGAPPAGDCEVTGVVCDSRLVRPGALFVAVPGSRQDGARFASDALQRGAVGIVAQCDPQPGLERRLWIRVPDARAALAALASALFHRPTERLQVIGITGTNGKTTCAYLCDAILRAAGRRPGLLSTVEYRIGDRAIPAGRTTPEAAALQALLAQMVDAGCSSAVMEVSSHAADQQRVAGIDFDVGVFTNLTRDHLDYHGTLERYFAAKASFIRGLGRGAKRATAAINADDPWGRTLLGMEDLAASRLAYGLNGDAAVRACDIELGAHGARFEALTPWGRAAVGLRLMGRFNVSNALAALAACGALGVPLDAMCEALGGVASVPGRLERIPTRLGFDVYVDYAHTDDALQKVLATLREITRRRLIVVFGCGGDRDTGKREPMGRVACALADYAVITSDNPRRENPVAIMDAVRRGFEDPSKCETIEDRAAAIRRALALAREGDVVLVAGKGHETVQEFAQTAVPFDDRVAVRRALETT
jgi:UDP-N-acetylmuramoyl-L-alanyl-D-glutamate--2,6-diaminopimelate ligase